MDLTAKGFDYIITGLYNIQLDLQEQILESQRYQGKGMTSVHTDRLLELRRQVDKDLGWFVNEQKSLL